MMNNDTQRDKERQEAKVNQKRKEIENLRGKINVADATIRKLVIRNSQLEEDKKKLIDEGHKFANTRLEETEREKASLQKAFDEQQQITSTLDAKISELSKRNRELEEKTSVLGKAMEERQHLEQKVISQHAVILNLQQVLVHVQCK